MFFKYLENHKFLAFSHRGGALENKENTIEAFQKSIEIGYQYIETDVQCTKDDKLIIFHDNELLRINNQNIKELPHNLEAEQALLGAILLNNDTVSYTHLTLPTKA